MLRALGIPKNKLITIISLKSLLFSLTGISAANM